MDSISTTRLEQVIPELARKVEAMEPSLPFPVRVVQGLRTQEDQARIWAQGRTAPGDIVTDAPPLHSMHEFGLAVDLMPSLNPLGQPYKPDGVAGSSRYITLRAVGEALGLKSGSRWGKPDWPHFQMPNMPDSPTDQMRLDFEAGGLELVWDKYRAGVY